MTESTILRIVVRAALILILMGLALWFLWAVRYILVLVIISVVLATGLSPAVDALSGYSPERRYLRLPRAISVLILYIGLIGGLALILLGIIPPVIVQAESFIQALPAYLQRLGQVTDTLAREYPFLQGLGAQLTQGLESSISQVGSFPTQASAVLQFFLTIAGGIFSVIFLFVLTLYLIVDSDSIRAGIYRLLPAESRPLAATFANRVREKIAAWLLGQIMLSTIIGVATFVGLLVLGVPYPLLLAVITAIGELIPMVGPILAAVPTVLVALFVSPLLGVLTVLLYIIIQQLENHLVVPQVMRRAVDLPPAVIIIALLMGGELLGIIGAILALPIAASVSVIVSELVALRDRQSNHTGGSPPTAAEGEQPPGGPAKGP